MTIETLCDKYPALRLPTDHIDEIISHAVCANDTISDEYKERTYRNFKANISCIGLEPEEYEFCIRWFCIAMEY